MRLLICFLLFSMNGFAQKKCKPGFTYIPGMSSSSYVIIGDCYPDSIAKKIWKKYWKSVCYDTQMGYWRTNTRYSNTHEWNDSTGCISKEKWSALIKGEWVDVSKEVADSIEKIVLIKN